MHKIFEILLLFLPLFLSPVMKKPCSKNQMQSAETDGSTIVLGTSIHRAVNGISFSQFTQTELILLSPFLIIPL